MEQEKIFADGFIFKRRDTAPEFVIGNLSVKVDEAITFLKNNQKNNWVNLSIKKARSGNTYIELDTFEPTQKGEQKTAQPKKEAAKETKEDNPDLPF